jgi:hypothetical protein
LISRPGVESVDSASITVMTPRDSDGRNNKCS